MIKLEKPDIDMESVIKDCISNITVQPTLAHINASKTMVMDIIMLMKVERY